MILWVVLEYIVENYIEQKTNATAREFLRFASKKFGTLTSIALLIGIDLMGEISNYFSFSIKWLRGKITNNTRLQIVAKAFIRLGFIAFLADLATEALKLIKIAMGPSSEPNVPNQIKLANTALALISTAGSVVYSFIKSEKAFLEILRKANSLANLRQYKKKKFRYEEKIDEIVRKKIGNIDKKKIYSGLEKKQKIIELFCSGCSYYSKFSYSAPNSSRIKLVMYSLREGALYSNIPFSSRCRSLITSLTSGGNTTHVKYQ